MVVRWARRAAMVAASVTMAARVVTRVTDAASLADCVRDLTDGSECELAPGRSATESPWRKKQIGPRNPPVEISSR